MLSLTPSHFALSDKTRSAKTPYPLLTTVSHRLICTESPPFGQAPELLESGGTSKQRRTTRLRGSASVSSIQDRDVAQDFSSWEKHSLFSGAVLHEKNPSGQGGNQTRLGSAPYTRHWHVGRTLHGWGTRRKGSMRRITSRSTAPDHQRPVVARSGAPAGKGRQRHSPPARHHQQ
ncbi:hypothetical protein VNO77_27198 [Canavalia gladiata]|uniref:Uncharacterized protein n=1 Tax=Canavalia gladiata TaxID=3824 RepID=A0AAN9KYE2_CANGL